MQEFKILLNEWLNQWKECSICTDMLKLDDLNITNEDELICDECIKEWT
mgnify:FL=1